jgi:uncharacterized protein YcbK (DUF882 family)
MIDLTDIKYFKLDEILNAGSVKYKIEDIPENLHKNIRPTLLVLDHIRDIIGKPIFLNCTYRSYEHNLTCGGAPKSLHLKFNAIDWTIEDKNSLFDLYHQIDGQDRLGIFSNILPKNSLGLGFYKGRFIHLDTRRFLGLTMARWNG